MLNLNALFGSCESIFGTEVPRKTVKSVSSAELQMMEMEIVTDLANAEVDTIKASTTMSQLDQLLNMYNHVKQYGIDRTFLSLYNSNSQLNNMLGMKFPSCESVDSTGYPNSNISKAFLVAMEDEKEGILAKIGKGLKWIWEKIKHICSVVWDKIKSWIGLGTKKNKVILDEAAEAVRNGAKPKSIKRIITKKRVAAALAVIGTAMTVVSVFVNNNRRINRKMDEKIDKLRQEMWKDTNTLSEKMWEKEIQLRKDIGSNLDYVANRANKHLEGHDAAIGGIKDDLDKTDARLAKLEAELARIKQGEKTETIDNPTEQQTKEIIDTTQSANAELEKTKEKVDPVIKQLKESIKDSIEKMRNCNDSVKLCNQKLQALQETMKIITETTGDVCKQAADIQKQLDWQGISRSEYKENLESNIAFWSEERDKTQAAHSEQRDKLLADHKKLNEYRARQRSHNTEI